MTLLIDDKTVYLLATCTWNTDEGHVFLFVFFCLFIFEIRSSMLYQQSYAGGQKHVKIDHLLEQWH